MSSVPRVPDLTGPSPDASDVRRAIRSRGVVTLLRDSFSRFRFGDGFSSSRALGLQLALAAVPMVIAAVGMASLVEARAPRQVLRETMLELAPGASQAVVRATLSPFADVSSDNIWALVLGLAVAVVSLTTAMGQLERGTNRIYGIQRDRPTLHKYRRAFVIAGVAGLPAMAGFVLLVVAETFSEAVERAYGLDDDTATGVARPLGALLLLGAIAVMLRYCPRRRQPGWALLGIGVVVALGCWTGLTATLSVFLQVSAGVGTVYGPLTGVMALLVWAQLTSVALFFGCAVSAELELAAGRG